MLFDMRRNSTLICKKMHRSPWRYCLLITICVFVLFVIYLLNSREPSKLNLPNGVDFTKYEPFEPLAGTDFVDEAVGDNKIPKIIHWVNPTTTVEDIYLDSMKSFVKFNQDWTFYLWTYTTTRQLIKNSLPELLQLWDDHSEYRHIEKRRTTLARYIVLYVYGGVVIDLDARNYRSLDAVISKYSCIIPPNPYEESIITGVPYTLTNRVMMCRKNHPFFKLIIENLHRYQHMSTVYDAVGDGFLMTHYQLYNDLQRERDDKNIYIQHNRKDTKDTSPYFFQGGLSKSHPDAVYVPNSVYFTGTSNPGLHSIYIKTCLSLFDAPVLHQRACVHLYRFGITRKPGKYAFIDLHNTITFFKLSRKDVTTLIPEIVLFGDQ